SFSTVSVVRIASAACRPPCGESPLTSFGKAVRILSIGRGCPMTPVEAINTCLGATWGDPPTTLGIYRTSLEPQSPVQTLRQPLDAKMAWARPSRTCSWDTSTGAPLTWFFVKTAAARAGADE